MAAPSRWQTVRRLAAGECCVQWVRCPIRWSLVAMMTGPGSHWPGLVLARLVLARLVLARLVLARSGNQPSASSM